MSDIFLAYAREDLAQAQRVKARLEAEGWSVFIDVQTSVGARWERMIDRELQDALAVVPLWSPRSRDSDYVLEEAHFGKAKGILFPAAIEPVEFPYGYRRIQTADLAGWGGETQHAGMSSLLEVLREHLAAMNSASSPVVAKSPASSSPGPGPAPAAAPAPGTTFRDRLQSGGEGPLLVVIPVGSFVMGSPADEEGHLGGEEPRHEVGIFRSFAIGVHVVTFDDYERFAASKGTHAYGCKDLGVLNGPVINVSWNDAIEYCLWLSKQTGQRYRLPSEAEWEYCCRAGTTTAFHFGSQIDSDLANFDARKTYDGAPPGEYRRQTTPVGSFPANAFGLYDMHGNVWEWCQDRHHADYQGAPDDAAAWESGSSEIRVIRGGSWEFGPAYCRSASRYGRATDARYSFVGFRVCRSLPISPPAAADVDAQAPAG